MAIWIRVSAISLSFNLKLHAWSYRKCNMSCWWCMKLNCLKRIILDVVLCWEMIRYFALNFVLRNIPFSLLCFYNVNNALSILVTLLLKVDDLSRMYRLYHKIPKGLDPVSTIFKQVNCFLIVFIFMMKTNLKIQYIYTMKRNLSDSVYLPTGTDTFEGFPVVACYYWRYGSGPTGWGCCK